MTVQAIVLLNINDMETMKKYREKAGEALAKHGGRVVSAGPVSIVLEAAGDAPDVIALLEFPSVEKAQAWRNDPELANVHALRNKAGKSTIVIIPS